MVRILVPPGIGDIYWVLVKLKSFLEKNALSDPELTIVSYFGEQNSHLRSVPFLEMFPWIKIGNPQCVENAPGLQHIWDEAYRGPGRSIFPGVMGYDYFMAYNGVINSGGYLETADTYECDWSLPQIKPIIVPYFLLDYMVCFFPFMGTYESHERDFPIAEIAECINTFTHLYGVVPVFIGGKTEQKLDTRRCELMKLVRHALDLVGQTSLEVALQYVKDAKLVFGYHSGIPNLAAAMGKRTLLLWDDRYPDSTSYACVPPSVRGTSYRAIKTHGLTTSALMRYMEDACFH